MIKSTTHFDLTLKQWFLSPWFVGVTFATIAVIALGSLIRNIQIRGGGQSVAKMVNARSIKMDSKNKHKATRRKA